jgi:hypothetical protein
MRLLLAALVVAASGDLARAAVLGGLESSATEDVHATAVGGYYANATGFYAVAIGGAMCSASNMWSVAVGGSGNVASGRNSLAAGGTYNSPSGEFAMAAGGTNSIASGKSSMTAGGGWSTAAAVLSTAIGLGASIAAAHDSAVAISAYRSVSVDEGPSLSGMSPDPYWVKYSAPNQTCASMGAGSLTLCATNNITLLGAALVVNSVDVLKAIGNTQGLVAALQASGASQTSQITDVLKAIGNTQGLVITLASQITALQAQTSQIAALQAQLAALQAAFVTQCGAPATNSTGRRLGGCRSAAATDAPAPTQPENKLPVIVGAAVAGGLLVAAVAVFTAMPQARHQPVRAGHRGRPIGTPKFKLEKMTAARSCSTRWARARSRHA